MGNIYSVYDRWHIKKADVDRKAAATWTVPDRATTDPEGSGSYSSQIRTFHGEKKAPYVLPDDVKEGARLNLAHHLMRELWGGPNYVGVTEAELIKGLKVLDVGCGSGIWLAEMHRDFPNGEYFGVDISTSAFAQAFQNIAAQRITLVEGNVLERLPFEDNTFDYVHQQRLALAIPERLWPAVIKELYRVLKPGGVLDLIEFDPMPEHYGTPAKIQKDRDEVSTEMFKARGIDIHIASALPALVRNSQLFDFVKDERRDPNLGWGGEIGILWQDVINKGKAGMAAFATAALQITPEGWEAGDKALAEEDARSKAHLPCFRVAARRPTKEKLDDQLPSLLL
ncbi:S-adenosyl-L-methionine-dependent methyltransferase [Cladochytrium replicatum]|nr:S-adenosyl-L-methionine-dependent methyltransferase [Cladochytrium replicatum]